MLSPQQTTSPEARRAHAWALPAVTSTASSRPTTAAGRGAGAIPSALRADFALTELAVRAPTPACHGSSAADDARVEPVRRKGHAVVDPGDRRRHEPPTLGHAVAELADVRAAPADHLATTAERARVRPPGGDGDRIVEVAHGDRPRPAVRGAVADLAGRAQPPTPDIPAPAQHAGAPDLDGVVDAGDGAGGLGPCPSPPVP